MSKEKKQPIPRPPEVAEETVPAPLSPLEEEISLICLRYFRGDWDLYVDYLNGTRVSAAQRLREIPIVERLRERDRRTDFLAALVEDEIITAAESMPFEGLYALWELCLLLNPDSDPFRDGQRERVESEEASPEPPSLLH
jgi:hypothetical protein